jgi:hypothetical protein
MGEKAITSHKINKIKKWHGICISYAAGLSPITEM